ncbi:hypothetical protein PAE0475 [Pyrobaculum aerophilum str. IM2]|uniref:Uncharacterized protein n=1 Tax=Pyrobaculum aerophilum (strain ATCC 51768 / DSM 7523 / JCM 9630 / CIP 104966 / NBRC 100827 / IM2) TaxID=178306 RepID=Q8ZZ26_PYRAE|nr:hypothetical protein PAE0475 [Pyrobaculum aerophilum str. IM2]
MPIREPSPYRAVSPPGATQPSAIKTAESLIEL